VGTQDEVVKEEDRMDSERIDEHHESSNLDQNMISECLLFVE